jgi:hypothetical protein
MTQSIPSRRIFLRQISFAGIAAGIADHVFSQTEKKHVSRRIGIIGLDSSHSIAFTQLLNDDAGSLYKNYRVTVAYPKGSDLIESSKQKIIENTKSIQSHGVRIAASIEELLNEVDAVMLETNDGRLHFEQLVPVFQSGKPVFIDKPLAASLGDVIRIFHYAAKYKTPVFSSSALRYIKGIQDVRKGSIGNVLGAETFSPAPIEKSHPDLFWYGIHGVEMLYALMGTGCKWVMRVHTADTDIVTGIWQGERIGVMRGMRSGKTDYGGFVFGEKDNVTLGGFESYDALLQKIVDFFETGISPVSAEETTEIYAFMESADESKRQDGKPVSLDTILTANQFK